jgi:N-dimethylarginine dimethylaminohydrolase
MKKMSPEERQVNRDKAVSQFHLMYSLFSQDAMVYLLPPKNGLQDQVYITNAGMCLPHLEKTVILANFKAEGRPGEEDELAWFISKMGYATFKPPFFFEGEAELKWVRDNIYIGGYGIRTHLKALEWIEANFGARIIKIEETDPLTYHLDCNIFPLSNTKIIFNENLVKDPQLREMEQIAELIPVTKKQAQFSITNNLRVGSIVYSATGIKEMKLSDEEYPFEKDKDEKLELIFINLSEMYKSGAALSCCIFHLNYTNFFD